ncbi:branched-chain amino acid transport system permease protein LivM [Halarchaeum acidiphilum MH1-52-1]|uniref:Branched-chain amino acid transport system permease protein LivM n=1 Tax=Halarchaeum acidiphilum MH1-52-1 TaxID=1261545 RepID=U2YXP7_9EURY|nr:branched-chain amino acid ABC transporter permease [Halarchaeum acidiphilum]GAD53810.1 branched-chain amino acid transport system permease protein LivM [Halarchaeum acidiphilum MH1-52-1]
MSSSSSRFGAGAALLADANRYQLTFLSVSLILLATGPLWATNDLAFTLALGSVWAVMAMGWDIISGHTDYVSFGHSFIAGLAAYSTALIAYNISPSVPMYVTIPLSIFVAFAGGMVFAFPSLRLRGPYFSLITLVAVFISLKLVVIFSTYTNGALGIGSVPIFTYDVTTMYYVTLVVAAVMGVGLYTVSRSHVGRVFKAIGENERVVEEAGLSTVKFKLWAFTLSAIATGVGGVMLAHFYGTVSPANVLDVKNTVNMIAMSAMGGMGTVLGPLSGAYLIVFLRDYFFASFLGPNARYAAVWAVVLAVLVFIPEGVVAWTWRKLGEYGEDDDAEDAVDDGGETA